MFAGMLRQIWSGLDGDPALAARAAVTGEGALPSVFATTDLAAASIAAAGLALSEFVEASGLDAPAVSVDRRLASRWFAASMRPQGWKTPPLWDPIAGDYEAGDGWIRLHTNAPHHRDAAMSVLRCAPDRETVAASVRRWWHIEELEAAVVAAGGCAAAMRSVDFWRAHEQGKAVGAEPLMAMTSAAPAGPAAFRAPAADRPLAGLRVLDLTRILAGPTATRFLAAYGADVLRIDPPGWEEPGAAPEVVLGKRCARLDLKTPEGVAALKALLREADVFVNGYRSDALVRLGLGVEARQAVRPGLIDVTLDAYGWTGPWRMRRGFDSLVQMSSGIAHAGTTIESGGKPRPLPVQALDHAAGYLMAAAVLRGLALRLRNGAGLSARTSLARMAALLQQFPTPDGMSGSLAPETDADIAPEIEQSGWGPMRRVRPPLDVAGAPMRWTLPAPLLGSSPPVWAA